MLRALSFAVALSGCLAWLSPPPATQTLSSLKDQNRVLLVFALSASAPRFQQQIGGLQHHAGDLKERDLLVMPVLAQPGAAQDESTLETLPLASPGHDEQQALRKRFQVAPDDFTVVLVGKDGGEKLRRAQPISYEELARTIDAMPMRKDEMRGRSSH